MSLLETVEVQCPYCWEAIEIVVDCSLGEQEYVEDCFVCCRPILLRVHVDEQGQPAVHAEQENA
ncbi:MAG: CPXCG motif-containing cysteine-rich protein [Oleiphilaceae bacterium]|nr:CPXCG motif-containing cysteine-rich protein [Oleiphilaceae bacterium]